MTAKTVLAIVATLSLLSSLFAFAAASPPRVLALDDRSSCVQYDGFTADGDISEWDTSEGAECADLVRAGGQGGQTDVLGRLFVGYNCTSGEACFLFLAEEGHTLDEDPGNIHIDIDFDDSGTIEQSSERVHCTDTGVTCAFVEDADGNVIGVELCFGLDEGTYDIFDAHANFDDGETGATTEGFTITITCPVFGSVLVLKTDEAGAPLADATFEFTWDSESVTITTEADGLACVGDIEAGTEVTVEETAAPPGYNPDANNPQTFTVVESDDCETRIADEDDPDLTFVNALQVGSVLVLKTDEAGAPLADATFEFTWDSESVTITTEADGLACVGDIAAGTEVTVEETAAPPDYNPDANNPQTFTVVESDDCETRIADEDDPDLTFVNALQDEELGSITINKEIDCPECETRTPGFWFNSAGSHDDETNALMAELAANDGGSNASAVEVNIDGTVYEFVIAQDVRDFVDADTSGDWDGESGLSRDGALLRHFLATHLNVLLNGEECDLLSRELNDQTVQQILAEAADALAVDDEDAEVTALEKLTAINESDDAEENPLTCGDSDGTSVDGFTFDLFFEDETEPRESGTTGEDGTLSFVDLELGTWTIVETSPVGLECEIVDVTVTSGDAESVTLNEDGTITIELTTENQDVVITVVNDCEEGEEEEEEGELEIIKFFCPTEGEDAIFVFGPLPEEPVEFGALGVDGELPSEEGCTLGAPSEDALGATFTITGGDLSEPLVVTTTWDEILTLELAPGDYTITEQGTGLSADFTIEEGQDTVVVVFNFEEEEEEEGRLKILKFFCIGEGDPVFTVVESDATLGDVTLPDNCESPEPGDATFTLTMGDTTSGQFTLGDDGARLIPLAAGTYVLNEVDPNVASSDPFDVTVDETTTVIVFNFAAEGEQPGGNGGEGPGGEGTLGGNPSPDTAMEPGMTGSVLSAVMALLVLSGLGVAGYAARVEVRRRR